MSHAEPKLIELLDQQPRLLVVDDQPINIQALYQVFAPDHQVLMATGGARALAICREQRPDLVLLDVVMPEMDGYEVCRRLKADAATRDIPVIFVTAATGGAAETQALEAGAVDFITKPIHPPVVRARVKTHVTLKRQSDLLRKLAFIDGLTGVHNRRHFDQCLEAELRRAERNRSPLALALIDVDFFKRYNDRYGHQAGDECLCRVAAALAGCLKRPADLLARYGGEEFACILPETDLPGCLELGQDMVRQVRSLQIEHAASEAGGVVTVSIGIGAKPAGAEVNPSGLIALADEQLYRAKQGGRARACAAVLAPTPG